MKVLYCTSECVPFVKTGGLADVSGSLPKVISSHGVDIRVVLPKYAIIDGSFEVKPLVNFSVTMGKEIVACQVYYLLEDGVTYYFLENRDFFNRESLYGYSDDGERFGFFNRAILEMIKRIDFVPNIIHLNDWHTALIPLMYKLEYSTLFPHIKTILTIHNLQYQGIFDVGLMEKCGISYSEFFNGTTRFNDNFNFLKTGIVTSDYITTVSESYCSEILDHGEGLESVLRLRKNNLIGILNGIDYDVFSPLKDKLIPYNYDENSLGNKVLNKQELQEYLQLPKKDIPIIGMVSRLVSQKGIDLLCEGFIKLMELDLQLVILGRGNDCYEGFFKEMEMKFKDKFRISTDFNEKLGQLIYAGSDFLLMPSLFEPCGLSQMIAMRYGTIPIVRETGGLKDTVIPFNEYTLEGNGFGFKLFNGCDMLGVIKYALEVYKNKEWFTKLIHEAMRCDFNWGKETEKYLKLYEKILGY